MTSSTPTIPRDWRWFLGVVGRIFITLGLLILAFVAYQLWGTGIEFNASQHALAKDFEQLQQQHDATTSSSVVTATTMADSTTTVDTAAPTTSEVNGTEAGPVETTADTESDTVSAPPTSIKADGIQLGDVVASIRMPTISRTTYYVVAGVRTQDLKRGVGHYPGTPLPGQFGNASLAGHRTTYGHPFENVDRLKPGDRILFDVADGSHYEYIVDSQEVIMPDNTEVLMQPTDPKKVLLTLTTCHPKRSTKRRLVIHAHLDPDKSSAPSSHTANYVIVPPRGSGSGSTHPATTVAPATTAVVTPSTEAPTSVAPTTSTAAPTTTVTPDALGKDGADLARGWFHDSAAWPQIGLWGGLLALISLGGWWVGRRSRRRWLGWLVAAAPFVVVLYFFFQNVNRLLPPGL